jgi:hypothetical protein
MKHRKLAAIAMTGALVFAGNAGAQGGKEAKTTFVDTGVSCSPKLPSGKCLYSGVIDSESKKCIEGRKVKMFALINGGLETKLVDTGTTSKNGAFGGLGRPSDVSAAKFKVKTSEVGDLTCKGKSFTGA